jgi:hypothetical protein
VRRGRQVERSLLEIVCARSRRHHEAGMSIR